MQSQRERTCPLRYIYVYTANRSNPLTFGHNFCNVFVIDSHQLSRGATQADRFCYYTAEPGIGRPCTYGTFVHIVNGTRPLASTLRNTWSWADRPLCMAPTTLATKKNSKTITSDSNNYTRWTFCFWTNVLLFFVWSVATHSVEEKEEKIGSNFPLMIWFGWSWGGSYKKKTHTQQPTETTTVSLVKLLLWFTWAYPPRRVFEWKS